MLQRKRPSKHRDDGFFDNQPLFITCCTRDRKCLFDSGQAHEIIRASFLLADEWRVGNYLIMPDHLHFFVQRAREDSRHLDGWMKYFKSLVSKSWNETADKPLWQKGHWDTEMRSEVMYQEKLAYVLQNPVRAGLVETGEEWPYQGALSELRF